MQNKKPDSLFARDNNYSETSRNTVWVIRITLKIDHFPLPKTELTSIEKTPIPGL